MAGRNLPHRVGVLQIHLLVVAADDAVADHLGAPALFGHFVGVERFRHADTAIRSVGDFEAGMQAGVSVSTVAETVAGELVQEARDLGRSLIGFLLNRRSEAAVGQLLFRHHRWKYFPLGRSLVVESRDPGWRRGRLRPSEYGCANQTNYCKKAFHETSLPHRASVVELEILVARKGVATSDLQPQRARGSLSEYVEACGRVAGCDAG